MKAFLKKNYKVLIVFSIFFLIVLLQNHFVWLYHDDYAYASLSYVPSYQGPRGLNTSLGDLFSFLGAHYVSWGGRILYFFIEIILLRIGLPAYRIFQSIVTLFIFYLIYKIVVKKFNTSSWKVALATTLCYGLLEIAILRGGIYWISASILYFIPLLPLLLFVYLYNNKISTIKTILCGVLIFLACFSQEQVGMLALTYILLYTLYNFFIIKDKNKKDIVMSIIAIIGFSILMLSPGNNMRMDTTSSFYELSFISKIVTNVPIIISQNFGQATRLFSICFFMITIYYAYKYKTIGKYKKIADISIISTIIILLGMLLKTEGYFAYIYSFATIKYVKALVLLLFAIQLLLVFLPIIAYFYKNKHMDIVYLIIGAIFSQGMMIMAPYFSTRSALMFEIVGFILISYCFMDIYKNKRINIYYILIPLFLVCTVNFGYILKGYYNNNDEKEYNDIVLKQAKERIKNGEKIDVINLKKQQDIMYGAEEPYEADMFNYIEVYIKSYYDIPNDVKFLYE